MYAKIILIVSLFVITLVFSQILIFYNFSITPIPTSHPDFVAYQIEKDIYLVYYSKSEFRGSTFIIYLTDKEVTFGYHNGIKLGRLVVWPKIFLKDFRIDGAKGYGECSISYSKTEVRIRIMDFYSNGNPLDLQVPVGLNI